MSRIKVWFAMVSEDEAFFCDQKRIWDAKPDPKITFN